MNKNSTLHFSYKKWLLAALLTIGLMPITRAQNVLFQNFDGASFPPAGTVAGTSWKVTTNFMGYYGNSASYPGDSTWTWGVSGVTSSSTSYVYPYVSSHATTGGTAPSSTGVTAGTGSYIGSGGYALYGSYYNNPGSSSTLITPPINFSANPATGTYSVSLWAQQFYDSYTPHNTLDVYVNTSASLTGATLIGSITFHSNSIYSISQGSNPYMYGVWLQYAFNIPASFNSNPAVYIMFTGNTNHNYCYHIAIDDVSVDYTAPCNNTPGAPSIISGPISTGICAGNTVAINAADPVYSPGISYIWQDSVKGGAWATVGVINNVNGLLFTTPGLFDTTYVRLIDSCQKSHSKTVSTNIYKIPVIKNNIPYLETFNITSNGSLPSCYTYNDNYSTNWQVQSGWHAAGGAAMNPLMVINDPAANAAYGKNSFFTLPGLTLQGGTNSVYAIHFKYARGKDNPYTNTGTAYPEHLQVYANSATPGYQVSKVTSGTLLFDKTINFDNVADTIIYFAPPATGGYYLSWFSNTQHPASSTGTAIDGGYVGVDSISVNVGTCVGASFTAQPVNVSACVGNPATLSAVVTGTGNTYQWKKNGTNIAGAIQPIYTITTASVSDANTYSLAVTNPCGGKTSDNVSLTVNTLPTPNISPSVATTVCSGDRAVVTASPSGNGSYTYIWRRNDTVVSGSGATYTPDMSARYSYIVTDGNGCSATSAESPFTVNPSPAAIISPSGPTTFCNGDSVTLNANTASGLTYQWIAGGSALPSATGFAYKATVSSNYQVKVTLGNCSTTSLVTNVNVTAPPSITIHNSGSLSFCGGGSVTLTAPVNANYSYQWRLNGSNINGTNSSFTATQPGSYDVIVTASGACSGVSQNALTVAVEPSPEAFITTTNALVFCEGDSAVLNAQPDQVNTYTYIWLLNGQPIPDASVTSGSYTAYGNGSYTVSITNSTNCSSITPNATVVVNPLPVVNITGTPSICSGNSTVLSANIGEGFTYQWKEGTPATNISSANGANYTVSNIGTYAVALTDANGCKATSAPVVVTSNTLPTSSLTAGSATSFCPGGSVVLTASSDIGTPTWYKNGNKITTIPDGSTTYTASAPGTYTVNEEALSGCTLTSVPVTVINYAVPGATISVGGATTFCPGGDVILSTPAIVGYVYQWRNGITNISGETNPSYKAATDGTYSVVVSSNNGCTAVSTIIPIATIPAPIATIAATGPTTFCSGNNVVLNTNEGTGLIYTWQNNGIALPHGNTSSYPAATSGAYTVTIANSACNVTSSPVTITVKPLPVVNVNASGPTTFCSNSSITLTASAGTGYSYQWMKGTSPISSAQGTTYQPDSTGTYTVSVTNSDGCTSTSLPVPVTVNQAPTATVTTPGSTILCSGDTSLLIVNAGAGVYSYQWYANTNKLPGAIYQTYKAVASGIYTAEVTSSNGCIADATSLALNFNASPDPVITVNNDTLRVVNTYTTYQWYQDGVRISGANGSYYIPKSNGSYTVYVTSGACSGLSDAVQYPPLGVANVPGAGNKITIYPNPATSVVHIDAPVQVNAIITGIDGKVLVHADKTDEVNISQLVNGIYLITIYDAQNNAVLKIEKFVKSSL